MSFTVHTSPLISAEELRAAIGHVRVVDCSHDLGKPELGREQFGQGRIPGAVHAHLDADLSGPMTGKNGRHPLPDAQVFAQWLGKQGIGPHDMVVAYDRSGGMYAARLWWLLVWIGHTRVQVLDGGWQAWLAAGGASATATTWHDKIDYGHVTPHAGMIVDADYIAANITNQHDLVVDARCAERYRGDVEPMDPRAGHIPGAVNRPFPLNLGADGRFKAPEQLAEDWKPFIESGKPLIAQCGSGVTAAHNLLALVIAGQPLSRLYPGSWSEWCSDASRPIATGSEPG